MSLITFKNKHLILDHQLVQQYFKDAQFVFVKWIKESGNLLIAPQSATMFYQVHKDASQLLMKTKNLKGDKTVALYDFFYESNLNENQAYVEYDYLDKIGAIKIKF